MHVICAAYYVAYLPVMLKLLLGTCCFKLPETLDFAATWIYNSSAAVNGLLYIALHSSVKRELRRYLPRCGRYPSVTPALRQPAGDGGAQLYLGSADTAAGTRDPLDVDAPVHAMTSSRQHVTGRLATAVV